MPETNWRIYFNPCTLKYHLYLHAEDNCIQLEINKNLYSSLNEILDLAGIQEKQHKYEREKEDKILEILKNNLYVEKGTGKFRNIEIISCSLGNQHSKDYQFIKEWLDDK